MSDGDPPSGAPGVPGAPGTADAAGRLRAKAPDHRPPWLVLLSALTLLYGGTLLVSSLEGLRHPHAPIRLPVTSGARGEAMTPEQDAIARQIAEVGARVAAQHPRALRGNALASLPVALVMLFAAASMLSRDRRGRGVALAAAWLGIAYHLGTLWLTFPLTRDLARSAGPLVAELVALGPNAARADLTPELMTKVIVASAVTATAMGILGSLVLIGYFGGRRGRVLYGLETAPLKSTRGAGRP
jgi:hypothetical protein